jgi:hypothetical protein
LDFVYSDGGDKKANDIDKNANDDKKTERLSSVSHFDLSTSFIHQLHNQWSS